MTKHEPSIPTTHGGSGYFVVMIWWNRNLGGFSKPYQTCIGRYSTYAEAVQEAKQWAEAEELE